SSDARNTEFQNGAFEFKAVQGHVRRIFTEIGASGSIKEDLEVLELQKRPVSKSLNECPHVHY
ncbi:MAG: hypothetical protein JWM99_2693, partial [Verrucomicrobiales bacterium]|nr:hypothetical protein [Verrucomicrobiales bacterium]